MKISSINQQNNCYKASFGDSYVNICAFSDIHGNYNSLIPMYTNIEKNVDKIFIQKNSQSTRNILAIVGDYFFNPTQKGYVADSKKTSGDFQVKFLNKFLESVEEIVPRLKTYFVIGNHDLDSGDKVLFGLLKKTQTTALLTNVDFNSSKELMDLYDDEKRNKFVKYDIITVKDSDNPDVENKVLLLGLSPMGLDYYFPKTDKQLGITDNYKVFDRFAHTEKQAKKEELQKTLGEIIKRVSDFKNDNPGAPVIILSHTGDNIAKMVADEVSVDLIISGHDHIDTPNEDYRGVLGNRATKIISLAQDGQLFKTVQLHFSKWGSLKSTRINTVSSGAGQPLEKNDVKNLAKHIEEEILNFINSGKDPKKPENIHELTDAVKKDLYEFIEEKNKGLLDVENKELADLITSELKEDNKPLLKTNPIGAELTKDNVRYDNNYLANTITDIILHELKKKAPDVAALGIASSAFRRGLSDGSTNVDLLNVLSGSLETQSILQVGNMTGHDLAEIIIENNANNYFKGSGLTLMQWSGIQTDKNKIVTMVGSKDVNISNQDIRNEFINKNKDKIGDCIKIKNTFGEYEPLDLSKTYKIALPNKCFMRSEITSFKKFAKQFSDEPFSGETLNDFLFEYLRNNNYKLDISKDERVIFDPSKLSV